MGDVVPFRRPEPKPVFDEDYVVGVLFGRDARGPYADVDGHEVRAECLEELLALVSARVRQVWRG